MLPHPFAIHSVCLSWLAGRTGTLSTGLSTRLCSSLAVRHVPSWQNALFYGGVLLEACRKCLTLAQVDVGIMLSRLSTCSPVPATSSLYRPQTSQTHKQTQFNNEVLKCTNTLLHAEAAVANRNRCSISVEAVYSEIDANTGPHPAYGAVAQGEQRTT